MLLQWLVTGMIVLAGFAFVFKSVLPKRGGASSGCNCSGCDRKTCSPGGAGPKAVDFDPVHSPKV